MDVLIVGCGYTGMRVAATLLAQGRGCGGTTRDPRKLQDLVERGLEIVEPEVAPPGLRVLYSLPPSAPVRLPPDPLRTVYISSTGVYGAQRFVDETTLPSPVTPSQEARLAAEEGADLVLRPAAIYGPGRGIHVALREGRYRLAGDGSQPTSRVHVDDLAALCVAALFTDLRGAFPVADGSRTTAREVAAWCAARLGLSLPPSAPAESLPETLRFTRAVEGGAIFRRLGVKVRYPDYRQGIEAALLEEGGAPGGDG